MIKEIFFFFSFYISGVKNLLRHFTSLSLVEITSHEFCGAREWITTFQLLLLIISFPLRNNKKKKNSQGRERRNKRTWSDDHARWTANRLLFCRRVCVCYRPSSSVKIGIKMMAAYSNRAGLDWKDYQWRKNEGRKRPTSSSKGKRWWLYSNSLARWFDSFKL